ncbi:MAG TPA: TspO/MBR family protein [Ensifer sp.]|nr:TspO/MBR family protein [Ensifer sp.]
MTHATTSKFRPILVHAVAIVVVVAVGAAIGMMIGPDDWYRSLSKPVFNPPPWVFAPVWTLLYIFIGIAFARTALRDPTGPAMKVWIIQMLLNWSWTPLWFGLHMMWAAFAVITALWLSIIAFILLTRKRDPVSALLFLPYLAWVSFAGILNATVAAMNS